MYGEHDLSSLTLFSGSFINYGYWGELPDRPITVEERTESQAELYRQVVARLEPAPGEELLELGCGLGVGAALTAAETGAAVTGLDRSDDQLERAAEVNRTALTELGGRLSFRKGAVTEIPAPDASFDAVYSVEMLQHVDDLVQVVAEVHRVLRPGGRFAAATFFAPGLEGASHIAEMIETVGDRIDVIHLVGDFESDLREGGLREVRVQSIGERVWHGFDRWISQTEYRDSWGRNWLKCYENGWIDYYLLTGRR